MIINEKQYSVLPERLQTLFNKLPNPSRDEVVGLFPDSKGEKRTKIVAVKGRGDNGMFGDYGETLHDTPSYPDSGSASRFFYCAKASKKDRNEGCEEVTTLEGGVERKGNIHSTVKPTALMQYLVRLVTPV